MKDKRMEMLELLNPIISTGKATLFSLELSGNEDAIKLLNLLGFDDSQNIFKSDEYKDIINAGIYSIPEVQFRLMNKLMIDKIRANHLFDIGCGYTTRGLICAETGTSYIGVDLPGVIQNMKTAVTAILPFEKKIGVRYVSADATDYKTLESAVTGLHGSFCITTEGLLPYLSDNDLDTFFEAIKMFMIKHESVWVTPDMEINELQEIILQSISKNDWDIKHRYNEYKREKRNIKESVLVSNSFINKSLIDKINLLTAKGFDIERIPIAQYLNDTTLLKAIGVQFDDDFRKSCQSICVWKISLRNSESTINEKKNDDKFFNVKEKVNGDKLILSISGRIDTITSPELLNVYNRYKEMSHKVEFDFSEVSYISSAGIRVLLIIFKDKGGKKNFRVKNVNEAVREIITTLGLDEAFLD